MEYVELAVNLEPREPWFDILAAELGELGFESFIERDGRLLAYIPRESFSEEKLQQVDTLNDAELSPSYTYEVVPNENWNKKWEENFQPVQVADQCLIRASFHPAGNKIPYEIVIEPKMAFGTGHHASTYLMVQAMLPMEVRDQTVLDMGSGTGVLAILARMKHAGTTVAVDNNDWAFESTRENAEINGYPDIEVIHGEIDTVTGRTFDIILANINRNVILEQLEHYHGLLPAGGRLLTSGFFCSDAAKILEAAEAIGFTLDQRAERNEWCQLTFRK